MKNNVWVCLEQNDGKIAGVSFEMLSEARKLADQLSGKVGAVLMGAGVKELAKEAVAYGADEVYVCDDEQLKNYRTDAYTRVLEDLVKGKEPGILLLPATTNGRDLAGRLASRLEAGLAAAADRYAENHEGGKTAPGYQFMRLGYFCLDNKDTKAGHPVFNRSVSLKESFKK